ncbi:alanine racemase [Sphingomonas sp. S17]|uniref:alanine racemase n=3 Tax=Sphingomonadaceae TaxID=41297 RepID=A0A411LJ25_SPHPI|nr:MULTISPECIES: alanine racemase [Sphingomonas]EGI56532.1 alanine racemase [Sphingomonas sp. S17]MBQ1478933.1 alanine racemase [Sphingomonas sp.]MCM3678427.1 alanine racemase [Sphingomonas paucimobilis]MDG5969454.1 alanine racemase [Sphingomonas paucimobilis]NNG55807.1 alanine racemase [Sphingomonas paucimobilis]
MEIPAPLRLRIDRDALQSNWQALDRLSGTAACGAAVKANGYGLGATLVAKALAEAGCRDFFVANWAEALALAPLGLTVSVLHGLRADDVEVARAGFARPVLSTPEQIARWRDSGGGLCDVMVDTGMNRLGVSVEAVTGGLLDGLQIETLLSHLACADEDVPMNARQQAAFAGLKGQTGARRMSLANSAGIGLGADYRFDLTRPGLALYGGVPRPDMAQHLRQVAWPEAQILQRRHVPAGETVGYNATWTAPADTEVAILNLGYADGYRRALSGLGAAVVDGVKLPVLGRVSMDLLAINVTARADLAEGDWLSMDYDLAAASAASGVSQYELLTGLAQRFARG